MYVSRNRLNNLSIACVMLIQGCTRFLLISVDATYNQRTIATVAVTCAASNLGYSKLSTDNPPPAPLFRSKVEMFL